MCTSEADHPDSESLHYLWTSRLDPLFWREGRANVASGWYGHVPFAHWLVGVTKPRILVELGTQHGVSYSAFCEAVLRNGFDTRCYAVDTWKGDHQSGHYGDEVFREFRRFHDSRYSAFSELLRGTFDDALAHIPDSSVDLLHIDGLHTYEAVRHDFENWRSKLSQRAVILFHDTNVRERDFGVWRLWQELCPEFPAFEFLHGHGLGLLAFGPSPAPDVNSLCRLRDTTRIQALRERFSMLGERWILTQREQMQAQEIAATAERVLLLEREISARDTHTEGLEREIGARIERIRLLDQEFIAQATRVLSLETEVAASEQRALSLERQLTSRITSLETEVAASEQRALSLERQLAAREARILSLETEADELKAKSGIEVILVENCSAAQQLARAIRARLEVWRERGDRLTGGGVRSLSKRVVIGPLRSLIVNPVSKALSRSMLPPWRRGLGTETAALQARMLFLEAEVEGRDQRILYLETEINKARTEVAYRIYAEKELKARVVQRSAEIGTGVIRVNTFKTQGAPVPVIRDAADSPNDNSGKLQMVKNLSRELADFLTNGRRLSFPPQDNPDVSIIVVLFNQAHFTFRCLRSVLAQVGLTSELILVDNNSTDATRQLLRTLDNVQILQNRQNTGFILAVNQAAATVRGRTILLLNSDAFLRDNALASALQTLESDDKIGAVGGKLVLPSGRIQEAGSVIWSDGSTQGYARNLRAEAAETMFRRDVDYCSGAFLLTRRRHFNEMGKFDPIYAPAYYEDADYCLRLWTAGLRVVYEPKAVVDHYESGSGTLHNESTTLVIRNRKQFCFRHADRLQQHLPASDGNLLRARERIGSRRRLLVIDNEVPHTALGSGYPRMRAILNEAVADGWFVTFYPLQSPAVNWQAAYAELSPEIEICDQRGASGLSGFLAERPGYYQVIVVSRPDNITLFNDAVRNHPHLVASSRLIYDAEAMFAAREILRARIDGRSLTESEVEAMIQQEVKLTADVDAVVAVNAREAQDFRIRQSATVHVLTHPTIPIWDAPGFDGRTGFLFVGRLLEKEAPNYQGLAWFLRFVWPEIRASLDKVTLTVAGAVHPLSTELYVPGVTLLGQVEDLRPLYDRARVFVSPIRFSAGLPIKILEAAASGLPVVGTELMVAQLGWRAGEELEAADDPAEMAKKAVALYENAARWQSMQGAARLRTSREHSATAFRSALRALLAEDFHSSASAKELHDESDTHRITRVNAVWNGSGTGQCRGEPWMAHPLVRAHINRRASGDPNKDAYGRLIDILTAMGWNLPVATAVSLCCGEGQLERGLAGLSIARRIVGYDLAAGAIQEARAQAIAAGLSQLEYEVRDLENDGLGPNEVDVVFAHSAVHHISRLEALFDSVHAALRPGGLFHLNEYVGPDRFQWTERQLAEINDFLRNLPEHYRRLPEGQFRSCVQRPTVEDMLKHDPSEAVRSSQIEALATKRFHILERRALGGSLLHMALSDIVQNFDPNKEEDQTYIRRLIDREERLMKEDALGSDFLILLLQREL
jgi:O-antigen biosynthesis protein